MRVLTQQGVPFEWSQKCAESFEKCKALLTSSQLLVHYDPTLPIVLYVDASPVGIGCVLNHVLTVMGKEVERPVMYASASLTKTQQAYAQIDREALAVVFGVSKFYKYLWGRSFKIVTDKYSAYFPS